MGSKFGSDVRKPSPYQYRDNAGSRMRFDPATGQTQPWDERGIGSGAELVSALLEQAQGGQIPAPSLPVTEKVKPPRVGEAGSASVPAPRLPRAERPNFEKELGKLSEPPKRNVLRAILESLPAAAAYASGNTALGAQLSAQMYKQRDGETNRGRENQMQSLKWRMGKYERQHAADLKAADPVTIGRNMVRLDPRTNQATTVFKAPAEFEEYARAQGLEPGSAPYNTAMQDYVLRSNGPTAHGYDVSLDNTRTGNRIRVEDDSQGNRVELERLRRRGRIDLRKTPPPRLGGAGRENLPTVSTPQEAMALPPGTKFRTPDGRIKIR